MPLILPSGQIDSGLCRLAWPSGVGWTLNDYRPATLQPDFPTDGVTR